MLAGYNAAIVASTAAYSAIVSSAATNTLAAAGYHTMPPSSSTAVQYLAAPTASILPPGYSSTLVQYGGYQYAGEKWFIYYSMDLRDKTVDNKFMYILNKIRTLLVWNKLIKIHDKYFKILSQRINDVALKRWVPV